MFTVFLVYVRAHKRTHSVVERGIGQMKRRFHVLHSEIRLSPERASRVITVCGILHNLCQQRNIPQPEDRDDDNDDNNDDDDGSENVINLDEVEQSGLAYRDYFVNTHWNWHLQQEGEGWQEETDAHWREMLQLEEDMGDEEEDVGEEEEDVGEEEEDLLGVDPPVP
ncbi:putative nuclease HARBI1 isoform X2 [Neoarius graeffei]|uniref:putative nuclease HARBI1 isoform X2 n=1 Tax=Neoarius graeffei TaxID=443677 RepID=UPI00298C297A|nr:putative nuclease HARBI1 isoform X2 [Neoarius graeffei]